MKIPVQRYLAKDGKAFDTISEAVGSSKPGELITPVIEVEEADEPEDIKSKLRK